MPADLRLRLIATSDLHANILPYDYYRDRPDDTVGLARTATLIAAARAEVDNSILVDNGDLIQGTPLGDYCARAIMTGEIAEHPMIAAMNGLGYDAGTLGNHEFNYGLEVLEASLRAARFPFVSANILTPEGVLVYPPWTILDRDCRDREGATHRLRIGIIGFVTPQIVQWDSRYLAGRETTVGIVEAARRHVPALRAAGVDLVVALCHSGISRHPPAPGDENAALDLAGVAGIDAIVIGHQHLLLPGADFSGIAGVDAEAGALGGVPAVMPGFWGGHIGVIDLMLSRADAGWRVAAAEVETRAIAARQGETVQALTESDRQVVATVRAAHDATLAAIRAPVGALAAPLNSYFALVADNASVRIVNAAQLWYVERLIATTPALGSAPLLSASAPFKSGGRGGPDYYTDVPAGPIALKHVADLYPYPNGLRVVKVTGRQVRAWLERSASVFCQIDPTATAPQRLLAPDFAGYDFDCLDGVTYRIDVSQPPAYDGVGRRIRPDAHRIQDLRHAGAPIDEAAPFLIVTNSYRASGGGGFPGCDGSTVIFEAPDANRDALIQYIEANPRLTPPSLPAWRFVPWPASATVTLLSASAAAGQPSPPGLAITPLGPAEGGFTNFRVETL